MNDKIISKKNFLDQIIIFLKKKLRYLIVFSSLFFVLFLFLQLYLFYISNQIKKNSIDFFLIQNTEDTDLISETINRLSSDGDFYGILSKLEIINFNLEQGNNQQSIALLLELLNNENLNKVYQSAIASNASYQFITINMSDYSLDFQKEIQNFISFIDEDLLAYKGTKLELRYLLKILEVKKNNIDYSKFNEAIEIYNDLLISEFASPATKERVNKIHEFFTYQ